MSYEILDSLQDSNLGVSYIVDVAQHDVETPRFPKGERGFSMKTVYVDGGCSPNPGHGAWAVVTTDPLRVFSGYVKDTTNNRMEIMALIQAIKMTCGSIRVFTDSSYVADGFSSWMFKWHKRKWKCKNADLWKQLYNVSNRRGIFVHHIKGHNGDRFNEMADHACTLAIREKRGSEDFPKQFPVAAPVEEGFTPNEDRKRLQQAMFPHVMPSLAADQNGAACKVHRGLTGCHPEILSRTTSPAQFTTLTDHTVGGSRSYPSLDTRYKQVQEASNVVHNAKGPVPTGTWGVIRQKPFRPNSAQVTNSSFERC